MSKAFVAALTARRSIYALSKKQVLPDAEIVKLIQEVVKHSPSSFNSMSARAVVLLGKEHDVYWNDMVPAELKKVSSPENLQAGLDRLKGFALGSGTVLFFEDNAVIKKHQEMIAAYADRFSQWSEHSSGMAQINTWTALELEGFGANLQHYGKLTESALKVKYSLPETFSLKAELVFGHPQGGPKDKNFLPDSERVRVFGTQT